MPKSFGGIVGWLVSTVVVVFVGMVIISRVGFIRDLFSKASNSGSA